jgi:Holliday junction resolvasome RuvABC endonuclease subunit
VGIDPSLANTGVCGVVDGVAQVTEVITTAPDHHRPARFVQLREAMLSFLTASRGQLAGPEGQFIVAMETEIWTGSPVQNGDAAAVQMLYQVLLWERRDAWCFRYLPVNVSHVKKWLGAKQKNEVLLQVFKRYGKEFTNDNAADAFVIAMIGEAYATYILDGDTWPEWTKPQLEVLDKLRERGFAWEHAPVNLQRGKKRAKKLPAA